MEGELRGVGKVMKMVLMNLVWMFSRGKRGKDLKGFVGYLILQTHHFLFPKFGGGGE
jgi:hypothetical protein